MSRIYFHSEHGEAEVSGCERALFGCYCSDALLGALGLNRYPDKGLAESIERLLVSPRADYVRLNPAQYLATFLSVASGGEVFDLGERGQVTVFAVALNTLLATASDSMALAARIHGQCELHCYVEGPNRDWLARLISNGRSAGIFRRDMGWEAVAELLASRDDGPVVLSYSVCVSFPDRIVTEWEPPPPSAEDDDDGERADEAWAALPDDERWRLSMDGLRARRGGAELRPDQWAWPDYYFEKPVNAFHVAEAAAETRGEGAADAAASISAAE